MGSEKVLIGLLAGVVIGATLGILFAPESGRKTRKKISKISDDYADEMKQKFNEFAEAIAQQFEAAKEETHRLTDRGIEKVEKSFTEFSSDLK